MSRIRHTSNQHAALPYVIGYGISVALTIAAYLLVKYQTASRGTLVFAIFMLAILQLLVQLVFFLHLGDDRRPRWRLVTLGFAVMVVVIIVFGSLWIMENLDYNMHHDPDSIDQYLIEDEGMSH